MQTKTELIREARLIAVAVIPVAVTFVIGDSHLSEPRTLVFRAGQTRVQPAELVFGPVWTTLYMLMALAILRGFFVCGERLQHAALSDEMIDRLGPFGISVGREAIWAMT